MAVLGLRTARMTFSSHPITFSHTRPNPGGKSSCPLPVSTASYGFLFLVFFPSTPLTKGTGSVCLRVLMLGSDFPTSTLALAYFPPK